MRPRRPITGLRGTRHLATRIFISIDYAVYESFIGRLQSMNTIRLLDAACARVDGDAAGCQINVEVFYHLLLTVTARFK